MTDKEPEPLNLWRAEVERLTDYFDSDSCDPNSLPLGELIYFIGESESDGVLSYVDRRSEEAIRQLSAAAELIGSKRLAQVVSTLEQEIEALPKAEDISQRISLAIEANDEDPFRASTEQLYASLPKIERRLDQALVGLGVVTAETRT